MTALILWKLNTQILRFVGLLDRNGNAVNTAVVTATLYTAAGVAVSALTNVALAYVAASAGNYEATVAATFDAAEGAYRMRFIATDAGRTATIDVPVRVQRRTAGAA